MLTNIELPSMLMQCRGCQAATAEFPSIYCEGCLEEMESAEEAHDNLGVEDEELEEGFQIVSPRGILQRSVLNDLVPTEATEDVHRVIVLQVIVICPASMLESF